MPGLARTFDIIHHTLSTKSPDTWPCIKWAVSLIIADGPRGKEQNPGRGSMSHPSYSDPSPDIPSGLVQDNISCKGPYVT